jgi:PIN domain nuclease of toxin-antitoxin system
VIVLDTHVWIWWTSSPSSLSKRARAALERDDELLVPAICCWEVAMLVAKKRLELDRDVLVWLRQALAQPRIELAPLTVEIAARSAELGEFHGDAADRLIVATAVQQRAVLVSKDERVRSTELVDVVW